MSRVAGLRRWRQKLASLSLGDCRIACVALTRQPFESEFNYNDMQPWQLKSILNSFSSTKRRAVKNDYKNPHPRPRLYRSFRAVLIPGRISVVSLLCKHGAKEQLPSP